MRTLYGMRQSPWTEKARWALDHHGIAYVYKEHVPLLGELGLRRKVGGAKASVPLLLDGEQFLPTALAIARYADRIGRGPPLFPRAADEAVVDFADLSDVIIGIGRMRVLATLRTDRAAQREALPSFIPGPARSAFWPMAFVGARFLASKYDVSTDIDGEIERTLRPALERIRRDLAGKPFLLHAFSFADVAIASALHTLRPTTQSDLGPATRAAWTNEPLAREFEDLLMWRDAIYAKHR